MAKKIVGYIKLQIPGGQANPAPPVGPALGQHQVNIMQFCQAFNADTQDKMGTIIPVEITVYEDRSFTYILKTPPAAVLLKQAADAGLIINVTADTVVRLLPPLIMTTAEADEVLAILLPLIKAFLAEQA